MATKTRRELAEQALADLGLLSLGQPAGAEELAKVEGNIDPLLALLSTTRVIDIPDSDEFEEAVFLPLAARLAEACAVWAGRQEDQAKILSLESKLRVITNGQPTYETVRAEYF